MTTKVVIACATMVAACSSVLAQSPATTPNENGMRFNRFGEKTPDTLAPKAGGPTERIEIQTTDDHIDCVVKAFVIEQANASEVFELIQVAVELEGGKVSRISPGSTCEVDLKELTAKTTYEGKSILVVTAPEWMMPHVAETIQILDSAQVEAASFGTAFCYLKCKHRTPSEIAELVRNSTASPFIVLLPDDSRQLLYIEDTPSYFGGDLEAFRRYDVPPPQIETRVRIFEIDENDAKDVGLDWYSWKKGVAGGHLTFAWGDLGDTNLSLESLTAELSFNPLLAAEFLNYLASNGKAEVLTDTRMTQINGKASTVQSIAQVPYVIQGFVGNDVADSPLRDSPEALDVDRLIKEFTEGVVVEMTPRIADDVEVEVRAEVASHIGYTPNQSVPIISSSEVNTVVLLEPGRAAILGGLTRRSKVNERAGVALLMDIPWIGNLFAHEVEREHRNAIVVTIELNYVRAGSPVPDDLAAKLATVEEEVR